MASPFIAQDTIDLALVLGAGVIGFIAMRRNSRAIGVTAGVVACTVFAGVLLMGAFIFPLLFYGFRKQRGKGFGWILLASTVFSTILLAWRMPWPGPLPSGPQGTATATVMRVDVVRHLWPVPGESQGEPVRLPLDVVTLAFVPSGTKARVDIVDTVDHGSVQDLRDSARVSVTYSPFDPQSARIAGATRAYARDALVYFLEQTYGIAAALVVIVYGLRWLFRPLFKQTAAIGRVLEAHRSLQDISTLSTDDPRRKALEALTRRRT